MKLPVEYEGYTIEARKLKSGTWVLEARIGNSVRVSYKPPIQVIYLGDGTIAYGNDIDAIKKRIDNRIKFDQSRNKT